MRGTKDDIDTKETASRSETMGGLIKGLAIIEMFGAGYDQLTVADAARGSGTTRAAARRCLLTLTTQGYLEHDGKFFRPRARLSRLGGAVADRSSLIDVAGPVLADLRDRLNESTSLAVLDGRSSLFVARATASWVVSTGVQVGGRLPAYCSATGRILLGALDDGEIREYLHKTVLEKRSPKTITDAEKIFEIVRASRLSGACFSDEELELGLRAMAVPVKGKIGTIVAAMSVSASAARVSIRTMKQSYLSALQTASATLSRMMESDDEPRDPVA
jgi:IclR family pca regulon transcriptional regulator